MRRAIGTALFFVASLASAYSAKKPAPAGSPVISGLYIGEGGGGGFINAEAGDCFENCSTQGIKPPSPRKEAAAARKSAPAASPAEPNAAETTAGNPGAFVPRKTAEAPARENGPKPAASQAIDRSRYSLWDGLEAPLELPSDKVKDLAPDQASRMGRQDYEAHILAERAPVAAGSGLSLVTGGARLRAATLGDARKTDDVFVAVDMDLKSDAQWKDAVADLGRTVGFRQDPRFEPVAQGGGRPLVSFRGWMSAQRLAEALRVPSVARVQVERGAARLPAKEGPTADILVGIRIPRDKPEAEVFNRALKDLSAGSGFRWKRTIGTQSLKAFPDRALIVEGEVPVAELSRVMAHPDVLKIAPAPGAATPLRACAPAPARPSSSVLRRFLAYVLRHAPALIALTLLVLLPSLGGWLRRLTQVFIPYQ